jgi:hypothetical protein
MNSNPRRVFLQTASATLVVPFVETTFGAAQKRPETDPVLRELARQAKGLAQQIAKSNALPSGEGARHAASVLRLLAAHAASSGFDARVGKALRTAIAEKGRQAVLNRRPDLAAVTAELGITVDVARLGVSPDDPAARSAALDVIMKNGVSSGWLAVAHELESIAARIDKQRGVQLIRQDPNCGSAQWAVFMAEVAMLMSCTYGLVTGPETCAIATATYLFLRFALITMGCG